MRIFSGLFRSRDKPTNSYDSPSYSYFFGRSNSGKRVSDRTAMQHTVVYACVRVLSEAIAQLPLHVYQYTNNGKERVPKHPLYFLLHDQPNPEMTSFIFRETLMAHLLIYGNAYAQIIRNGRGEVMEVVSELTRKYITENSRTAQNQDEYNAHYNGLVERYEKLQKKSISLQKQKEERFAKRDLIGGFISEFSRCKEMLTEFDEQLWIAAIDKVTVFQDDKLVFAFKDGTEIEV